MIYKILSQFFQLSVDHYRTTIDSTFRSCGRADIFSLGLQLPSFTMVSGFYLTTFNDYLSFTLKNDSVCFDVDGIFYNFALLTDRQGVDGKEEIPDHGL